MDKWLNFKSKADDTTISVNSERNILKEHIPWIEKYRPKTMDDIAHQDEVVAMLKKCISGSDFPNFLFYGPPGTGKTSTILAAAKDLFGLKYRDRVLELNASDERGISVIREKVKRFSQNSVSAKFRNGDDEKIIPSFKLIILDEADSMTTAAQSALRRTMEVECKTTRFCLICNYISKIIDPITSRCAKFRFKSLDRDVAISRLLTICAAENVNITQAVLSKLVEMSEGDLRQAITLLQRASLTAGKNAINEDLLNEIVEIFPQSYVKQFMEAVRSNSFDQIKLNNNIILSSKYSITGLIAELQVNILQSNIKDSIKAEFFERLTLCEQQIVTGADEYLQMMALACFMMEKFKLIEIVY